MTINDFEGVNEPDNGEIANAPEVFRTAQGVEYSRKEWIITNIASVAVFAGGFASAYYMADAIFKSLGNGH